MKRILFLAALCLALSGLIIADGEYGFLSGDALCTLSVTDAGDTAEVIKLHTFTGRDSFTYTLDLEGGVITGVDSAVEWVSPSQKCILSVTGPIDTEQVYACSLDCGTHVYGFTYDPPSTDTTVATFLDSIVDSINAVAGMSDTIAAEDSATYAKIISKIAQDGLEGDARWAIHFTTNGTVLDTTSRITTVEMVCDSMVATLNADDSASAHFTAANSGDTIWTITSDKKGVAFTVDVGDSAQDTAYVTANVTSYSATTDTIFVPGKVAGWSTLQGKILVGNDMSASTRIGNADSLIIWLYTELAGDLFLADSAICANIPGSLMVTIPEATGDSLLREGLWIKYLIRDSCSDTTATVTYPISWHMLLK